jgi:signal transduction histidine kinase
MRDVDTILGLKYSDIIQVQSVHGAHISKADHPVSSVLKTKNSLTTELLLQQDGDEQKYIDMNVSPILNPQNDELYGAVINLRDISARKKEEMAKSEFISTASHEMRTPVATIEGYLALAMNPNVANIDDRAKDLLDKAHESTEHLGRLFQDLLISSRAEDGGLVNHPKVVELGGLIQKQVDNHQKSASDEGLELRFIIGADSSSFDSKEKNINPLYYINVDPDRINEVLSNSDRKCNQVYRRRFC